MSTYGAMQTRIADEMVNESVTTAQIKLAIQSAISHYERRRFFFNESRDETFNTVAGQEFYDSADSAAIPNLSLIDKLTITVNGSRYALDEQSWEWLDRVSVTTTATGEPTDFCYYDKQIRLYPIPGAVYSIRISGLVRLAALSADSDTNAWMTDAEELIRQRAKFNIAADVIYADDIATRAAGMESIALRVLNAETARRLSSRLSGHL